jgi:putative ABC transport system permease protein
MIANLVPLRFACRTLVRSKWYACTAIGTITLTIALSATVFAVVDGVLFKPLPYPEPDRIFHVVGLSGAASPPVALSSSDLRNLSDADSRIRVTAFGNGVSLTHPDRPDAAIWSARIAPNFFDVLGQRPLVGGFTQEDFAAVPVPGLPRPAIVTHSFWRQRLAADPAAVGRIIDLLGQRFLIAGILPPDFLFPEYYGRRRPDILVPSNRSAGSLTAIVRLGDGISREDAKDRLDAALTSRVGDDSPNSSRRPGPFVGVQMRPLSTVLGADERPFFSAAFAGAALLILLGAINITGLSSARLRDRERELAIRIALGAGRRDLVTVLLGESFVIAILGAAIGILLASPLLVIALTILPETLLLMKTPEIDWRVTTFAVLAGVLPVVVFALAPAFAAMRDAPAYRLAGGTTSTPRSRGWRRSGILATESALGILLLVAGSLMLASFTAVRAQDVGLDPANLAIVDVRMMQRTTPEDTRVRQQRVFDRLRQVPGVLDVAAVDASVLDQLFMFSQFKAPTVVERFHVGDYAVSGSFFKIAGLRLLAGRFPTPEEIDANRPLAVVSEETAQKYWPNERAVGQVMESEGSSRTVTVVGIVEEARFVSQDNPRGGQIYIPRGMSQTLNTVYFVKTAADPTVVVRDLPLVLRRDVPDVLVRRAESLDQAIAKSVRLYRFRTSLFALSAGAGLLLLSVGVCGLVASGVARRVREIGIRGALGAQQRQLVIMIVLDYLRPVIAGVATGLLASWWTTRLLTHFLYEVDPHEPFVWIGSVAALMVVASLAAWLPARRASAVNPTTVLRID